MRQVRHGATVLEGMEGSPAGQDHASPLRERWWEGRAFAAFMIMLAAIPLLLPTIPPLVDVPGHIGRLHLMLGGSPFLDRYFSPGSLPIGNLGADMFVVPTAHLIGAELATRIIVTLIPPATVAAMLWVAREAHGRLPPSAAFAVPLVYSHPFLFGFVNYSVSLAFALASLAVWLRLGKAGRLGRRALVMVPLALITFVAHVSGWGLLGLMAFGAEVARRRGAGEPWSATVKRAVVQCLPLALPLVVLLLWRSGASGGTERWFDLVQKLFWFLAVLRDRWLALDLASLAIIAALLVSPRYLRGLHWSSTLTVPAGLILLAFLALPVVLFGSGYADMRIMSALVILMVLSVGPRAGTEPRHAQAIAIVACGFAVLRLAVVAASLHLAADRHRQLLAALDHVPLHSRLAVLVDHGGNPWPLPRNDHFGSMAIARRDSFSNDQWELAGGTSLKIHHPAAGRFESDESQLVDDRSSVTMARSLKELPVDAFDALWLIDSAPRPDPDGWVRIYHAPGNDLYLRADQAGRRATQP